MAEDELSRERLTLVLAALALVLFLFPLTLHIPLVDPDEGLHAAIAQEMVERGSFLQPTLLGEPFLDKPIFYFWAQALSLKAFGMTPAAVRAPGLLFGFLGVLTTAALARALFGPVAGLLAGCFYATLVLPLAVSQAASHDIALVPWVNLAMLFLWRADQAPNRRGVLAAAAIAGGWLGLSTLTKGLAGVVIVLGSFGAWQLLRRRPIVEVAGYLALAVCVGAAVASPWFLYMDAHSPGYLHYYFVERHVLGYATASQRHGGAPFLYYLPVLVGGGLPWVLYLPSAGLTRRQPGARWWTVHGGSDLLWLWLLVGLTFLTLGSSKLAVYLLPVFPAVAILAATAWSGRDGEESPAAFSAAFGIHAIVGALLLPVTLLLAWQRYGLRFGAGALAVAAILAALYVPVVVMFRKRRASAAAIACLALWAAGFAIVLTFVFPRVANTTSARDLALGFNRAGRMPAQLLMIDDRVGSVVFYLTPQLRAGLDARRIESIGIEAAPERIAAAPEGTTIAVRRRRLAAFEELMRVPTPCEPDGEFCVFPAAALRR